VLNFGYASAKGNFYIEIHKSLIDSLELIERVTLVWITLSFVLILAIFFLNKIIFKRTWKDFFEILQITESYDLKNPKNKITLKESEISEFNSLNEVLTRLLNRVETDYNNQKELTANSSHELQTPLAIIRSKAELLMQSPELNSVQHHLIQDILHATDHLAKLNRSLLTISKIDYNQFPETETLDITIVIESHLQQLQGLTEERGCHLIKSLEPCKIIINPILLDLLLVNLFGNAIIHNYGKGGKIFITLKNSLLTIANTGTDKALPEDKIFQRFFKKDQSSQSTGIGLSIVKKICDYYGLNISYSFQNKLHTFSLDFTDLRTA